MSPYRSDENPIDLEPRPQLQPKPVTFLYTPDLRECKELSSRIGLQTLELLLNDLRFSPCRLYLFETVLKRFPFAENTSGARELKTIV